MFNAASSPSWLALSPPETPTRRKRSRIHTRPQPNGFSRRKVISPYVDGSHEAPDTGECGESSSYTIDKQDMAPREMTRTQFEGTGSDPRSTHEPGRASDLALVTTQAREPSISHDDSATHILPNPLAHCCPPRSHTARTLRQYNSRRWPSPLLHPFPRHAVRTVSRTIDRYIPCRDFRTQARENFLLATAPAMLSQTERKQRKQSSAVDPFGRSSRVNARQNQHRSLLTDSSNRSTAPGPSRIHVNAYGDASRTVSHGAVWNVGGSAAAVDGVLSTPDGHGGRVASGTNAPMYTSAFLNQNEPSDGQEMHERRLAAALDFDQANRVLAESSGVATLASPAASSSASASPISGSSSPTVWKDNHWKGLSTSPRKC